MSPRPDVSKERRRQILDAAMVVFSQRGYDKARMDDIAQEAGLSKGSLYWYFKSKKDLMLALLDATTQEMVRAVREIGPEHGTASDRIRLMANQFRGTFYGVNELTSILSGFFLQHRDDEDVQNAIDDVYQIWLDLFVDVVRDGIASGEFRDDLDVEHIAGTMGAAFDGLAMQVLFLLQVDWQTRLDQMVEILVSGICRHPDAQCSPAALDCAVPPGLWGTVTEAE